MGTGFPIRSTTREQLECFRESGNLFPDQKHDKRAVGVLPGSHEKRKGLSVMIEKFAQELAAGGDELLDRLTSVPTLTLGALRTPARQPGTLANLLMVFWIHKRLPTDARESSV